VTAPPRASHFFKRFYCFFVAVFAAIPVSSISPAANAQQAGNADYIESVFVIGQRRAYQGNFDDLENPSAVQSIDSELLREVGALNLNDALDLSASVARQNNFGGLWNSFSIRGFAGDINLPSGFLVNGFNAGRGFGGPRDIAGIESVEVLKGPRSALFGRGEPGGTINLITKRPQFQTGGDVRVTVGRWNQLRLEGDVQSTLGSNDRFGFRLAGLYEDAGSFRNTVEPARLGLSPSFTWHGAGATDLPYEPEFPRQELPSHLRSATACCSARTMTSSTIASLSCATGPASSGPVPTSTPWTRMHTCSSMRSIRSTASLRDRCQGRIPIGTRSS